MANDQRAIDISNLRFYARMAAEFKWSTDVIHFGVIQQTLNEIAERLAAIPAVSTPRVFKPFRGDGTGGELEAIEAALKFVDEYISPRKCDAEAVSECVRCTAVYLAEIVKQIKNSAAVATPRCPQCKCDSFKVYRGIAICGKTGTCGYEGPVSRFFQPTAQPSPEGGSK